MTVYAKSDPPQALEDHIQRLIDNYEKLKSYLANYPLISKIEKYDEVIRKILYYHDLGKINHKFQNKLKLSPNKIYIKELKDVDEIPHEWLSLAFIPKEDKRYFKKFDTDKVKLSTLVQYCVAFHHTRNKAFDKDKFEKFVKYDLERRKSLLGINYELNFDVDIDRDIRSRIENNFKDYFELLVLLKGMLHKCDYSASAEIDPEIEYQGDYQRDFEVWLKNKGWELKPFQKRARELSDKSLVLVASTGSGKTEFSMNWINGQKAFYLLGIKTAVNEMYKRFKAVFKDNVSLLHGDIVIDYEEEDEDYFERIEKARNLSYPITIATADQLIASAFKYNGFEFVYLTASYSKVVVDEIQSFSPDSIAAIMVFLKEVHSLGGKFLIMTATLPPFILEELRDLNNLEILEPVLSRSKRHKLAVYEEPIENSIPIIKKELNRAKKVLVVCNTVAKAQQLYNLFVEEGLSPSLIHSRFILKDRKNKESQIMSTNSQSLWIATQVVEASLDLDFDVIFTECAPIDSLLQRFGRCWRKREEDYTDENPNVYVFAPDYPPFYDREITERTYKFLYENFNGKIITEEDKQWAIDKIFKDIESTKYYQKYKRNKELLELGFRTRSKSEAEELFRRIAFNFSVIPRPVYEENSRELDRLLEIIEDKKADKMERIKAKKQLKQFVAPVQLFDLSLLSEIPSSFCRRHKIFLLNDVFYSYEKGIEFSEKRFEGVILD